MRDEHFHYSCTTFFILFTQLMHSTSVQAMKCRQQLEDDEDEEEKSN
jgi:hypothetical protein